MDVKYKDSNYIGNPIRSMKDMKEWKRQVDVFKWHVDNNPKLNKAYSSYKKQVKDYNKQLDMKFMESDTFHRGTSYLELDGYLKDQCLSCDYYDWNTGERGRAYDFLSLSMNEEEVNKLYNFGVIVEYDGGDVRRNGKRVEYTAEPIPFPAQKVKLPKEIKSLEGYDKPLDAFFSDEQEVRIPTGIKTSDVKIDKITFSMSKHMGSLLQQVNPELNKKWIENWDSDKMEDKMKPKDWLEKNKKEVLKSVKDKYGKLTDNIEVKW